MHLYIYIYTRIKNIIFKNQIFDVAQFAYIEDERMANSYFNSGKVFITRNLAIFHIFLKHLSATTSGYQY